MSNVYMLQHNNPELWKELSIFVKEKETNIKALILKLLKEELKKNKEE